jgi:glutathione S-transferase
MFHLTAIVTCLAVAFYFFTSMQVARARAAFGIKAPAITGHPDFERVFRVQMNTLEWMPIFLPSLWLFAIYINDAVAAALGTVWIVGRILYWNGYKEAANKRSMGFARPGDRRLRAVAGRTRRHRMANDALAKNAARSARHSSWTAVGRGYFVSGQPLSFGVKNALSPGTTASCL